MVELCHIVPFFEHREIYYSVFELDSISGLFVYASSFFQLCGMQLIRDRVNVVVLFGLVSVSYNQYVSYCIIDTCVKYVSVYRVQFVVQINAMANRATGKGYENETFYTNIKFQFWGIDNIHVMRASLQKLVEGLLLILLFYRHSLS